MNWVTIRDDELIRWGMKATQSNLLLSTAPAAENQFKFLIPWGGSAPPRPPQLVGLEASLIGSWEGPGGPNQV